MIVTTAQSGLLKRKVGTPMLIPTTPQIYLVSLLKLVMALYRYQKAKITSDFTKRSILYTDARQPTNLQRSGGLAYNEPTPTNKCKYLMTESMHTNFRSSRPKVLRSAPRTGSHSRANQKMKEKKESFLASLRNLKGVSNFWTKKKCN